MMKDKNKIINLRIKKEKKREIFLCCGKYPTQYTAFQAYRVEKRNA